MKPSNLYAINAVKDYFNIDEINETKVFTFKASKMQNPKLLWRQLENICKRYEIPNTAFISFNYQENDSLIKMMVLKIYIKW